jgi:hypothetical protein
MERSSMSTEFDTAEKPELCRMEVKIWLSKRDPETEQEFLEHCLSHLISGAMAESSLMRYSLSSDGEASCNIIEERQKNAD